MARVSGAARTIAWQSDDAWRAVRSWLKGPRALVRGARRAPVARAGAPRRRGRAARRRVARRRPRARPAGGGRCRLPGGADRASDAATLRRGAGRGARPVGRSTPATRSSRSSAAATPRCRGSRCSTYHGLLVQFLPEWDVVRCLPAAERVPPLHGRPSPPRGGRARVGPRAPRPPPRPPARRRAAARPRQGRARRPHRAGVVLAERVATRMGFGPPTSRCSSTSCAGTCCSRATPPGATSGIPRPSTSVVDAVRHRGHPRPARRR